MNRALCLVKDLRVKAVAGLKTQTRTPIKKQPPEGARLIYDSLDCYEGEGWAFQYPKPCGGGLTFNAIFELPNKGKPPCEVGDRLYLAEPYQIETGLGCGYSGLLTGRYLDDNKPFDIVVSPDEYNKWSNRKFPYRGTSGRFMYTSLARHWFEVTGVGAELLQDISVEDAKAEGIRLVVGESVVSARPDNSDYIYNFKRLWDSIYGDGAWARNDWVWKRTFRKVEDGR